MKYIVNWTSGRVHIADDEGRTHEACNINQIRDRDDYIFDVSLLIKRFKSCRRCFRAAPTNRTQP